MSKKKDTWSLVTKDLKSKLSPSEFHTWFSQTSLKKLSPDLAIIEVPNKFFSHWLRDKYIGDIKKTFKNILNQTPEIRFTYNHPLDTPPPPESPTTRKPDTYLGNSLHPSMTFDRFITGEYNRFAWSSALEVANRPAHIYNPLYIFSELSLGKTHLLNAIGNHVVSKGQISSVKYVSSDSFTSDFTYSLRNKKHYEFRDKYRNLDFLLFDDVQLLANRKKTQEEFLSIFDFIYGANKQIVISGDRPPNKLKNINSQLKSRLGCGLLTEIQLPDQERKISIIKEKMREENIDIPDDVIFFLAKSSSDIKTLIKNIVRLETYASLNNREINISALKSFIKTYSVIDIGVEDIKSLTAGYFNISSSDLTSTKRKRAYSYPRQIAMYLCRKYTDLSFKDIGDSFGHKDHSTVIYAIRRIEKYKSQRKDIRDDLKNIENLIG